MGLVEAAMGVQAQRMAAEELYEFQKRVCAMLVELGVTQLLGAKPTVAPTNFDRYEEGKEKKLLWRKMSFLCEI